jgi:hypothetical protein
MGQDQNEELPILVKWMDLLEWLLPVLAGYPRKVRHTFAERIEGLLLDIFEDLISTRYSSEKVPRLREINLRLERLRMLLRLSHKLQYLSHAAYERAIREINEAGRMLGGWIRQQEQR